VAVMRCLSFSRCVPFPERVRLIVSPGYAPVGVAVFHCYDSHRVNRASLLGAVLRQRHFPSSYVCE
jgi:hypothetical protein